MSCFYHYFLMEIVDNNESQSSNFVSNTDAVKTESSRALG